MADDAYEDLTRRLAVLVAKLDSTYDELLEANRAQREFNEEQREFNRQQIAINQRLETLLERAWRSSTNGHTD
jgi:hypothetical protein